MDIRLTPDLEAVLTTKARLVGSTPEELALDILRERLGRAMPPVVNGEANNLEEFLADYIGVLPAHESSSEGQPPLSDNTGEAFTHTLIVERIDALRKRLHATCGVMDDSTDLIREDRER